MFVYAEQVVCSPIILVDFQIEAPENSQVSLHMLKGRKELENFENSLVNIFTLSDFQVEAPEISQVRGRCSVGLHCGFCLASHLEEVPCVFFFYRANCHSKAKTLQINPWAA
jgi:hypothetical protein